MRKERRRRLELASKIARVTERSSPHWASVERRIDNRRVSLSVRPMCMPELFMGKARISRADLHSEDGCSKLHANTSTFRYTNLSGKGENFFGELSMIWSHKVSSFWLVEKVYSLLKLCNFIVCMYFIALHAGDNDEEFFIVFNATTGWHFS